MARSVAIRAMIARSVIARSVITMSLMAAATAGRCAPALAQKVDFSGQKITLAIATPPGGGYDLYGRLVGRFLGAYLPGNPTVVPQNMPGAGSLIAANWLYNVAPRDGTAIGIMPSATAFENLLGNASARFDARRFNWLVSLNHYTAVVAVWHASPFRATADLFSKELLVGASGSLYSASDYGGNLRLLPEMNFQNFKDPNPTLPRIGFSRTRRPSLSRCFMITELVWVERPVRLAISVLDRLP